MECNKDEAVRARAIAEQKMQTGDFPGARKFVLKARQLFPDLDNLSQLLTVCEVHCSAQDRVNGSEMDWYGILQVEKFSDETVIKKQFRKLALALHPDKNKFAGAEAAFKLIGEAQRVLTDPTKRSLYDMKYKGSIRPAIPKPPVPNQFNRNRGSTHWQWGTNNIPNPPRAPFAGGHPFPHQQPQHDTFWTSCSSCNTRFQYFKQFVGKMLICQSCRQNFIAHDLGPNAVPSTSTWSKFSTQKGAGNQETSKLQQDGGKPSSTDFHAGFPKSNPLSRARKSSNAGSFKPAESQAGRSTDVGMGSEPLEKSNGHVDVKARERDVPQKNNDASKSRKPQTSKVGVRKRGRNSFEDTSSDDGSDDDVTAGGLGCKNAPSSVHSTGNQIRRSLRQKKQVSYDEDASEKDEFVSCPPKKSKGGGSAGGAHEKEMKEAGVGDGVLGGGCLAEGTDGAAAVIGERKEAVYHMASSTGEQSVPDRKAKFSYIDVELGKASSGGRNDGQVESEFATGRTESSETGQFHFPDQEFCDFDKDRREGCFAVNQVWACFDPADGMPRFYAWIRRVLSPGFGLRITWLEADPDGKDECAWHDAELPVACGKYQTGDTQVVEDRMMFSHQIHYTKGSKGTYFVYPRKGETWALFKNWDIKWSLEPEKHKSPYQYEYVEILSNFDERVGVKVALLEKVKGFVSVFKQADHSGILSFHILPGELYRFSHPIRAFRLTGKEGNGAQEGFMELDNASLPSDFFKSGNLGQFMEEGNCNKVVNDRNPKELDVRTDQGHVIPPHVQDALKLRRSPRDFTKRNGRVTASQLTPSVTVNNGQASASANHLDGKLPLHLKDGNAAGPTRSPVPKDRPIVEVERHDFKRERSEDKFQVDQVWALFCEEDGLPKDFAVVKQIVVDQSFKLHVVMLDNCPRSVRQRVCVGTFRANNSRTKLLFPSAFSHQVKAEALGKDRYGIYPRVGDIWAVCRSISTHCDEENAGWDLVEVLEVSEPGVKVVKLKQINSGESFYMAPKGLKSRGVVTVIPPSEVNRFSHQCCAVRYTGEGSSELKGCWVIDPSSIPGNVIVLD